MDSQIGSQKRYPGIQFGGVVRDMPHWSLHTGGPKRGAERRGQKGPPEEALPREGQSRGDGLPPAGTEARGLVSNWWGLQDKSLLH